MNDIKIYFQQHIKVKKTSLFLVALTMFAAPCTLAVRPFITDDATLIGLKRAELATWTLIDKYSGQFWHNYTMNLTQRFEASVAAYWGYFKPESDVSREFSYTAPLVQFKYLFRDYDPNGLPGVTIAAGSDLPFGKGVFVPGGHGAFAFLSLTQCFGEDEDVLIHANIGGNYIRESGKNHTGLTWGIGTQVKVHKGLHGVAEIVSGDPYIQNAGYAYQFGARYFVSDLLQFDIAFGKGFGSENRMPSWVSGGIRYVLSFDKLNRNGYARNGRRIAG